MTRSAALYALLMGRNAGGVEAKWKQMKKDYKDAWAKRNKSGEGADPLATCTCFDRVRALSGSTHVAMRRSRGFARSCTRC